MFGGEFPLKEEEKKKIKKCRLGAAKLPPKDPAQAKTAPEEEGSEQNYPTG